MTPPQALLSTDPLAALFQHISELAAAMPFERIDEAEQRELGGHLFAEGPALVQTLGAALGARPELFPEAAVTGEELLGLQREAFRWLLLRDGLRHLAQRAADSYLKVQGAAVRDALGMVRATRAQPRPPGLGAADAVERGALLVPAFVIVSRYYQGLEERKALAKKRRQVAAAAREREALEEPEQAPQAAALSPRAFAAGPLAKGLTYRPSKHGATSVRAQASAEPHRLARRAHAATPAGIHAEYGVFLGDGRAAEPASRGAPPPGSRARAAVPVLPLLSLSLPSEGPPPGGAQYGAPRRLLI